VVRIGTGLEVEKGEMAGRVLLFPDKPTLSTCGANWAGWSKSIVTSPSSTSLGCGAACACRVLRTDSLDLRGGASEDWLSELSRACSKAPSCGRSPSSESSCSHSSGSSTSASRSAAARQFGQMKIGYDGDAKSDLMHL